MAKDITTGKRERCPKCGASTHRCNASCRHCSKCDHSFFPGQPDTSPRSYRAFLLTTPAIA